MCISAKCEDFQSLSEGRVTFVTNGTHTSAIFTCGVGFTLDGEAQPECQTDGTWTTVHHTCGR